MKIFGHPLACGKSKEEEVQFIKNSLLIFCYLETVSPTIDNRNRQVTYSLKLINTRKQNGDGTNDG